MSGLLEPTRFVALGAWAVREVTAGMPTARALAPAVAARLGGVARLRIVVGSRAFVGHPRELDGRDLAMRAVRSGVLADAATAVASGGAAGVDAWAEEAARAMDVGLVVVALDGFVRVNVEGVGSWSPEPAPPRSAAQARRAWCLLRDHALVALAAAVPAAAHDAIAIRAAWSPTDGAGLTAALAREAGIKTKVITVGTA